ncbi:hypothetical protein UFOVP418_55 [uncultured Caudovirales phage]|uniref:Uncharacterized protein n=1 Tax=uncultured Caudovirales phage TaxID=2100421 RepID=A0A6J5M8M2_9CAUD|nr:hypothetical protein UFOVP418_55 [uncultured Caudovirales phage]
MIRLERYEGEFNNSLDDFDWTCGAVCKSEDVAKLEAQHAELLAALKAAEIEMRRLQKLEIQTDPEELSRSEDEMEERHDWSDEVYAARAAIAKAEGEVMP